MNTNEKQVKEALSAAGINRDGHDVMGGVRGMFHSQVHNLAFRVTTEEDADRYIAAVIAALRDIYGLEQDAQALGEVWANR